MGPHSFGDAEQVDRISDSVPHIVSSGLPAGRAAKFYFHWAQICLKSIVKRASITPQEILLVRISVT